MIKELRKNAAITFWISRNNPTIPQRKENFPRGVESIEIENKFGNFVLDNIVNSTDIKNYIAICDIFYDFFEENHLLGKKRQDMSDETHAIFLNVVKFGILIPICQIMKYRILKKDKKAYKTIRESLSRLRKLEIKTDGISFVAAGKKEKINKGKMYLINEVSFCGCHDEKVKIALPAITIDSIMNKDVYFVNRQILNRLSGMAVNLYIGLEREHLKKAIKSRNFSFDELSRETRYKYTLWGRQRPGLASKYILKSLEQIKKRGGIKDFEEITLSKGQKGVKISW